MFGNNVKQVRNKINICFIVRLFYLNTTTLLQIHQLYETILINCFINSLSA